MRIAVVVKQVPAPAQLEMVDGRLRRDGVDLEVNAYCRRANAMAVQLAGAPTPGGSVDPGSSAGAGGEVVVFTMGPPSADDALREMLACGADRGVHLCDPAFAGADTLATARALAAAVRHEGPFDLVLCGANSIDADTGQVGPEMAALLGLTFVGPARELALDGNQVTARLETNDGYRTVGLQLPAVIAAAERLCDPSKADPAARRQVAADRIVRRTAFDLSLKRHEVGAAGSPTTVGPVRVVETSRQRLRVESVDEAVRVLVARGALPPEAAAGAGGPSGYAGERGQVATPWGRDPEVAAGERDAGFEQATMGGGGPEVWCVLPGDAPGGHAELVGEAARLAAVRHARVAVVTPGPVGPGPGGVGELGGWGADRVLVVAGAEPEDWAPALATAAAHARPWTMLVQGTAAGRAIASYVAARNGWGLVGDAVGFDLAGDGPSAPARPGPGPRADRPARDVADRPQEPGGPGRLVAWKPAFGGQCVAAIESSSPVQMATVRPGVLPRRRPRPLASVPSVAHLPAPPWFESGRVRTLARERQDDGALDLEAAAAVIGVGQGVDPADYAQLDGLRQVLGGAPLAATRKVTDRGWLPRSRQVGVTGRSIAPRLYVAIGMSGKFNHMVGVAGAGTVLAIGLDPATPIFDQADVGLVGDWHEVVPALVDAVARAGGPTTSLSGAGAATSTPLGAER